MATDGDIDFTTYTREQLDGAVSRIDRERYPLNAQNLSTEYQRRRVAEQQAAEIASKSRTAAPPDHMLSAPKAFEVMFEPAASFLNWLGPSRNDFHLVGAGTVQVDDALVRVKGRRFAYLIGIPVGDSHELGRRYVVNVELQVRAVRFELRVPAQKVFGITLWLESEALARELFELLPSERTPDFTPQLQQHLEFERALVTQSPETPVTYTLLGLCVFVYVGTALGTDHLFRFDGQSLVRLGSNFGPYTTTGDWWRLITSMFLHVGLIHLAFNMWAGSLLDV